MNHSMIKFTTASITVLGLFSSAYASVFDKIEGSFNVEATSSLRLENLKGSVDISAWDKHVIKVLAVIQTDDQHSRDRISVEMTESSQGIRVKTHYKKLSDGGHHTSGTVNYTIMVPLQTELSAIDLVNGSLMIEGIKGEIRADLVNGSIRAFGLESDSEFNSVNGSISVSYKAIGENLNHIKLDTVNGNITLTLPEKISASLNVETMHGSINNDFGLKESKNMFSGRSLKGDISGGDIGITLESVNGAVNILKD
ncbi:MAG: DUF4097 and DUF4098 domain-containing protein YvlB [Alteromonadaceae bacterium]|jgi:DUF4097 and DUF4098 domain-containing protein YvlB